MIVPVAVRSNRDSEEEEEEATDEALTSNLEKMVANLSPKQRAEMEQEVTSLLGKLWMIGFQRNIFVCILATEAHIRTLMNNILSHYIG